MNKKIIGFGLSVFLFSLFVSPSFSAYFNIGSKGGLLTSNGTSIVELAAGTNDYVLTADSTEASGVKWAAAGTAGGNKTIWLAEPNPSNVTGQLPYLVLNDATTTNSYISWTTPDDFNAIVSVKAYWSAAPTSKNAYLYFASRAVGANESTAVGGSSDSIAATTYATSSTADGLVTSNVTAMIDGVTISSGDAIGLQIQRQGANASDTIDEPFRFHGYQVVYN